jgi:hypothetical protein
VVAVLPPPGPVASPQVQELVLVQVLWRAPMLEPPHSRPIDPPVEVPPEPLKIALHSREQPGSSSCILQEQEPWSEQTSLPGFVALRACIFSLVQISVAIYSDRVHVV